MRRTLFLLLLTVGVLAVVERASPPERPTEERRAAHGHRVLGVTRARVSRLTLLMGAEHLTVRRGAAGGWLLDDRPADGVAGDAVEELISGLVKLRALDAFRAVGGAPFGLDPPRGTITVETQTISYPAPHDDQGSSSRGKLHCYYRPFSLQEATE